MATENRKPIIYSGIQPTGQYTLGNYLGALRNWHKLSDANDCIYSVVDLHALTIRNDPAQYRLQCLQSFAMLLAIGLDPKRNVIYFQSHVHEHAELAWILCCHSYIGELQRMTQFKDKSAKNADNLNSGLMQYPVLMAADILLYQTDMVPVGDDQRQHIELCRDIAQRMNALYGDVFRVPEGYIPPMGARIMSLSDPTRKMSKSDEPASYIALLDPPATIRKKFRRAVTDLGSDVRAAEDKPGITNLMRILATLQETSLDAVAEQFAGKGYGTFKDAVADAVIETLAPVQAEHARLMEDRAYLEEVAREGAQEASRRAKSTLEALKDRMGLVKQ